MRKRNSGLTKKERYEINIQGCLTEPKTRRAARPYEGLDSTTGKPSRAASVSVLSLLPSASLCQSSLRFLFALFSFLHIVEPLLSQPHTYTTTHFRDQQNLTRGPFPQCRLLPAETPLGSEALVNPILLEARWKGVIAWTVWPDLRACLGRKWLFRENHLCD